MGTTVRACVLALALTVIATGRAAACHYNAMFLDLRDDGRLFLGPAIVCADSIQWLEIPQEVRATHSAGQGHRPSHEKQAQAQTESQPLNEKTGDNHCGQRPEAQATPTPAQENFE